MRYIKITAYISFILFSIFAAACSKRPQSSVLYYDRFGHRVVLSKDKFALGPHEGLLGIRQYYFACGGSAVLPEKYYEAAKAQAQYLKTHKKAMIQLQGFADAAGSANYNLVLGQQRSNVVASLMRSQGAAKRQVYAVSYGAETASVYTGESNTKDCRVDVVYLADE